MCGYASPAAYGVSAGSYLASKGAGFRPSPLPPPFAASRRLWLRTSPAFGGCAPRTPSLAGRSTPLFFNPTTAPFIRAAALPFVRAAALPHCAGSLCIGAQNLCFVFFVGSGSSCVVVCVPPQKQNKKFCDPLAVASRLAKGAGTAGLLCSWAATPGRQVCRPEYHQPVKTVKGVVFLPKGQKSPPLSLTACQPGGIGCSRGAYGTPSPKNGEEEQYANPKKNGSCHPTTPKRKEISHARTWVLTTIIYSITIVL